MPLRHKPKDTYIFWFKLCFPS